jgi:hypothetical protein
MIGLPARNRNTLNKNPLDITFSGFSELLCSRLNHQMVPGAGIEPARLAARDFESRASTNFTTRALTRSN